MEALFELGRSIAKSAPVGQHNDKVVEEAAELIGELSKLIVTFQKLKRPDIDFTIDADRHADLIGELADVFLSGAVMAEALGVTDKIVEQARYKHDRYFQRLAAKDSGTVSAGN